jgi:hypothetical protein
MIGPKSQTGKSCKKVILEKEKNRRKRSIKKTNVEEKIRRV